MLPLNRIALLTLSIFCSSIAHASPQWIWTRGITSGGTSSCVAYGICNDTFGNVLVAAAMQGTVSLGGSNYVSRGANDILVAKYDPSGSLLWARTGGGTSLDNANCIATDQAGNIYVAGIYSDVAIFGNDTLIGSSYSNLFILKFDPNGNQQWIRSAGGSGNDFVEDIYLDATGNLYIAGSFQSIATFGSQTVTAAGGMDAFLAKYDSQGNAIWVRSGSSTGSDQANGVQCDASGNVYLIGYFNQTASFGSQQVVSSGGYDIFWAKYDVSGNLLLLRQAGGTGSDYGQALTIDQQGNVFCTGFFNSSMNIGGTTLVASGVDFFLAAYDTAGSLQWARSYGGSGLDNAYDIGLNASHEIIISGYFENTLSLGPNVLTARGSRDILLAGFDTIGNALWGIRAGGANIDFSYSLSIDNTDNIYFDGAFNGPSDFGTDSLTAGSSGAFVSRLQTCDSIFVTQPQGYCGLSGSSPLTFVATSANPAYSYTWSPGGQSGTSITVAPSATTSYTVTADDGNGCVTNAITMAIVDSPTGFSLAVSSDTVCNGHEVDLFASWEWNNPLPAPTSYCTITNGSSLADEQITAFRFAMMSNVQQDTCGTNYSDYTSIIAPIRVNRGSVYPFTVTTDECDGAPYYNSGLSIYIDFNRDGDWNDAGEKAYTTLQTTLSPNTRTGSIDIPATASIGLTRMRVIVLESTTSPQACVTINYGEAEDYLLDIGSTTVLNQWSNSISDSSWIQVTPSASTTYTVTSTSEFGCVATASTTVQWTPSPALTVSAPSAACVPSAFTLDAGPGYASYDWTYQGATVSNSQTLTDSMRFSPSTREYAVVVTSQAGCTATDTLQVIASAEPDPVAICVVTVDTSSQYNLIVWEKSAIPDAVDSFLVYREITTNNYIQVGAVHRNALSVFTDMNVNVNSTNYRYKIAWRDTCGNTGNLSPYHSTIHLQYLGFGNLQWTSYALENNPSGLAAGYQIYRDDASTGNFQLLQTVSGTSQTYTDINYTSYPNARYIVDIIPAGSLNCTPTRSFSTSRSNIRYINGTSGIEDDVTNTDLKVFPNPADESIFIEIKSERLDLAYPMDICDVFGRSIKHIEIRNGTNKVLINDLAPGMYCIRRKDLSGSDRLTGTFIKR